ncbi:predicted protein [Lichtheimia corymbifera JMRC:FSU:9682]|uniref:Uncharacterized protein n=1 Tax=Lichtheimia corymbifera JMRC:FSU:9682 TaxID=1263082 RepID=A0A068RXE7_9FUNG|nr:predicted protein [Lichtheimia corymbifera JMRC:FSU:9682]
MVGALSAVKYPAIQALFALLSCNENDQQRDRPTPGWIRKHICSDHMALVNQHICLWRMDPINAVDENMVFTCRFASRNDGSYHVDTAEDDGGLDGLDEMAYIF